MTNSTAIFLDSAGLFLMMMMMKVVSVVVSSVLLLYVELLKLSPGNHLVSLVLDGLEGGEGGASSLLLSTASSSVLSLNDTLANLFLYTYMAIFLVAARAVFPAFCCPR
jgi:hypothetical protein